MKKAILELTFDSQKERALRKYMKEKGNGSGDGNGLVS